jgi:putative ABC transport system ATP-binding protein
VLLQVQDLIKEYKMGEMTVTALQGVSFGVQEGEFVVVLGPSGSGKSTVLNIVGGIDQPTSGKVLYKDEDISGMNNRRLTGYRKTAVGFVFQFYNLISNLTARENIEMSAQLSAQPIPPDHLLEQVGLSDRGGHFPSQMSGGQQQRVAIARALAKNPDLLLCDEPTGALDLATGVEILRVLRDFNKEYNKTVMIITHNTGIACMADRVITIRDGLIAGDRLNKSPISPEEVSW